MRLVEVLVPDEQRTSVTETLDEEGVDYVITDERSEREASIFSMPLPTGAVEDVLGTLRDAGLDESSYTVVSTVESATTPNIGELEDEYADSPGDSCVSHTELRTASQELRPDRSTFVVLALLSATVASAGLLLDSAIVIVGAMVIAPFVGASLSASVGAVIDDRQVVLESLRDQGLGLVLAIVGAFATGTLFREAGFVPPDLAVGYVDQIVNFSSPTVLAVTIALFAGAAGAITLATDLGTAIAGVAVAAALVPAAAAVGIGLVWGHPTSALGALVLLGVNVVFVNASALVTFRALGYRPSLITPLRGDVAIDRHTTSYAVALVLVALVVLATVFAGYQYVSFQRTATADVEAVLDRPSYERLATVAIQTEYDSTLLPGRSASVTVTVAKPAETRYPEIADRIRRRVSTHTDRRVTVDVRFLSVRSSS